MLVSAISFALTKQFVSNSIYTAELADRGELITHDKDKNALLLMDLDNIIEENFISIMPDMNLGTILQNAVAKSNRNIFPVVNEYNQFLGILLLNDIREIMFKQDLYNRVTVNDLMENAPEIIFYNTDSMQTIMDKFESSSAWNLPVVKDGEYFGFISKSKMLTVYRNKLIEVSS